MLCRVHEIIPPLRPFLHGIWSAEENDSITDTATMRVLPNTLIELDIYYKGLCKITFPDKNSSLQPPVSVIAQMQRFMEMKPQGSFGVISVFFSEASAYHFFGLPVKEVADSITALDYIWKRLADEMHERIMLAGNIEKKVTILQHYLLKQLPKGSTPDKAIEYCVDQVNKAKGQIGIEELANQSGISNRQLLRRFNDYVGLSPKELTRKVRFMHAVQDLKKNTFRNLTDITYNAGYYDQAHFIHDFREYSGLTPSEFLACRDLIY